jgi:hypothetical protein
MKFEWNRNAVDNLIDQAVRAGAEQLVERLRDVRCDVHGGQLQDLRIEKVEANYRVVWTDPCCATLHERVRQVMEA